MNREFDRKTAVVTGACGAVGAEVVAALAARGAVVTAVDHDGRALCDLVERLQRAGLRVAGRQVDISSGPAVESLVDQVEREVGPVDIAVNAADLLRTGRATGLTDDDWSRSFAINTHAVFHLSRAAAARMVPRGGGAIITVATTVQTLQPGYAAYTASKAAATAYANHLAAEVTRHGVRCTVITTTRPETPLLRSVADSDAHASAVAASVLAALSHHADGTAVGA
ncbi:SDR family NAD(P)-dependent oxidoreductase [Umezawaea endophytica]|uniref:SDR family NAD(P)-dependent oxidoreductase n=1 Tax=Umezawaea endophytica TaxID=1654476 RepID=A0A9X2VRC7_9PSEU|nr:SDR family NAD(P)-dependent oxidoreductase [Umezawaea endophytica]MCS7481473.1 SDR family NAD(P)-dependent oxidoreductase [Umezawaea endophytica]